MELPRKEFGEIDLCYTNLLSDLAVREKSDKSQERQQQLLADFERIRKESSSISKNPKISNTSQLIEYIVPIQTKRSFDGRTDGE